MDIVFYFILLAEYITCCKSVPLNKQPLQLNITDSYFNDKELKFIKTRCDDRNTICRGNYTKICAVRIIKGVIEYKEFKNSCFMFFSNLCEDSETEFYIMEASSCSLELTRRHYEESGVEIEPSKRDAPSLPNNSTVDGNSTNVDLRTFNLTQYDVPFCPDRERHPCAPLSCPNVYRPVCMRINHKISTSPKLYSFVNHCELDRFYCTHYSEFEVPLPEYNAPRVEVSFLDYSLCGSQRYLKFLFTNKATTSMGHYGWLSGNDKYTKILAPWERKPGYG